MFCFNPIRLSIFLLSVSGLDLLSPQKLGGGAGIIIETSGQQEKLDDRLTRGFKVPDIPGTKMFLWPNFYNSPDFGIDKPLGFYVFMP
jgi:hypothetical protein